MKKNKFLYYWEKKDQYLFLSLLLRVLSFIYLMAYLFRKTLYQLGFIITKELKAEVISVGNITLGGSGKTPFTLYLAKKLKQRCRNLAILTRGYKRSSKNTQVLEKLECVNIKWYEAGDEPFLLSKHLPETPVIIDKNRYHSGKIAQDKYLVDMVILDDGFQHWRLKRDLDILMIDSTVEMESEKLFPAGILREPLSSLKRAQVFILTRVDQSEVLDKIKKMLKRYNPQAPVVESILKVTSAKNWRDKTEIEVNSLRGKRVTAFCGIGNPLAFERTLKSLDLEILKAFFFFDHYIYSLKDLLLLEEKSMELGADFIITTEKDSIRLPEIQTLKIPLLVLNVELEVISGEDNLWKILNV